MSGSHLEQRVVPTVLIKVEIGHLPLTVSAKTVRLVAIVTGTPWIEFHSSSVVYLKHQMCCYSPLCITVIILMLGKDSLLASCCTWCMEQLKSVSFYGYVASYCNGANVFVCICVCVCVNSS